MFFLPGIAVPTLAVAMIYCCWARAVMYYRQRERLLRSRVAAMLWAAVMDTD